MSLIPKEKRETIVDMWQAGMPASEIAEKNGMSRNSVMGLIHRERQSGRELRNYVKAKAMPPKTPARIISFFEKKVHAKNRTNLAIHELTPSSCRFIVDGLGANSVYCGAKIMRDSYCPEHYMVCYVPIKKGPK